jgi:hypothetical protein
LAPIKREWRQFTDSYLNSKIHMIVCGRSGDVYAREWNDERQKYEVVATDTKMRTEKELAYEPSLLVELERVSVRQASEPKKLRASRSGLRTHGTSSEPSVAVYCQRVPSLSPSKDPEK